MKRETMELLEARRDLGIFLDRLPPDPIDHDLVELLIDMNRDAALAFRWDECCGLPTRMWFSLNSDPYVHRIYSIDPDVASILGELFLSGEIDFVARTAPPGIAWRYNLARTDPGIM